MKKNMPIVVRFISADGLRLDQPINERPHPKIRRVGFYSPICSIFELATPDAENWQAIERAYELIDQGIEKINRKMYMVYIYRETK
jgi:hypothetical protein